MRWSLNLDDSVLQTPPNPSPDEMVIQARGRRQIPLTFSPDVQRSPLRQQVQRAKLSVRSQTGRLLLPSSQIRTSPRKRLTLSDSPPSPMAHGALPEVAFTPSPDKTRRSPTAGLAAKKAARLDRRGPDPVTAIRGLSHGQLVGLMTGLLAKHPHIREELAGRLPAPDLGPLEEGLHYLKRNIYKALPSTRLESKTDSMAYNRVATHLVSFKRCLMDGLRGLTEAEQWLAVVDYTVMAWAYVKSTPVWDNPSHNNVRKTCFKTLASSCMQAIKKGNFGAEECRHIRNRLKDLRQDAEEIDLCIRHLEQVINTQ